MADVPPGPGRFDELRAAVARVRMARHGIDGRRAMLIAGAVLVPLGLLLILVGWYGVAHNPYLFQQLPYVVSGGILGLALTFIGGFVYFAYWLVHVADEHRQDTAATNETLVRIEALLVEQVRLAAAQGNGAAPARRRARPKEDA